MKRIICLITALCIVLGSFSFCFASATSWDTTDQANLSAIKNALTTGTSSVYGMISRIAGYLVFNNKGSANWLSDIYNTLNSNGGSGTSHSVAWWLADIDGWLERITAAVEGTASGGLTDILNRILGSLTYTDAGGLIKSFIADIDQLSAVYLPGLYNIIGQDFSYQVAKLTANNTISYENWTAPDQAKMEADLLRLNAQNTAIGLYNLTLRTSYGDAQRDYYDWSDLSVETYTPRSWADSQLILLSNIQKPLARLSYVLASDERIEAQEAAAANEEAVVDNFIDSSGAGSASPSDIGSISDLSSGYQSNFGSDASVSGIFNIFNSNNMGWFSQETANQLDTTANNRRGSSFETPLLDQQINDIYDQIGVKHD